MKQFFVLTAVMLAIVGVTTIAMYGLEREQLRADINRNMAVSVDQTCRELDNQINTFYQSTYAIASNKIVYTALEDAASETDPQIVLRLTEDIESSIAPHVFVNDQIVGISVYDMHGKVYQISRRNYMQHANQLEDRPWYQTLRDGESLAVCVVDRTLYVARTIFDLTTVETVGYVEMRVDMEQLDILSKHLINEFSRFDIVDGAGNILLSSAEKPMESIQPQGESGHETFRGYDVFYQTLSRCDWVLVSYQKIQSGAFRSPAVLWFIIFILLGCVIVFLYGQINRTERDMVDAKLDNLRTQINPHFLYNTMEMMDFLSLTEGNLELSSIIQALSDIFRYALCTDSLATVGEEVRNVQNYLTIISKRYPGKFTFQNDLPAACYEELLPRLSLQPIVENALTHGILKNTGTGRIVLSAELGKHLCLLVTDDGAGMSPERRKEVRDGLKNGKYQSSSGSIGLRNVNSRIKYCFGNAYGIELMEKDGPGTTVCIRLPFNGKNEQETEEVSNDNL